MKPIKKILFRNDKFYQWQEGDLQIPPGVVKEEDLKKDTRIVKAHSGKELYMFDAKLIDQFKKLKRGPAVVIPKDIGFVISTTGLDKNSIVLDAGTGCGFSAILFSLVIKKVYTYEKNPEFFKISKQNIESLGIKNIDLKQGDVYEKIDEKDIDLIFLDLPEPWNALSNCYDSLKSGSFLVCYLPTTIQVSDLINRFEDKFILMKVSELLEREWYFEGKKARPKSQMLGHTAFLVIARKV